MIHTDDCRQLQALHRRVAVYIAPYRAVLLAFSGGLDSMVLLDIITALRDGDEAMGSACSKILRAVHINHGLNRDADRWVKHCAYECHRRKVKFNIVRVVIDSTQDGLEAAARGARYRALAATLAADECLLTAHHQDDQVETLLLALKRGSGPAGLASMTADMPFHDHRLVRPLLDCSRAELEAYACARELSWIEDESNTNMRFDRNFLRLQILPLLRQRWPHFASASARSAQLCAGQERLLDELLAETLDDLMSPDGSLRLTPLMVMSNLRRAALLRRWLANLSVRMPSRLQLSRLWQEVALSRRDAVAKMQIDDCQVRRFRDRLYVLPSVWPKLAKLADGVTILPWPPGYDQLQLPTDMGIIFRQTVDSDSPLQGERLSDGIASADTIVAIKSVVRAPMCDELVSIRFGPVRGLLHITGRRHGRTLKKIWQELEIPPWLRGHTPLLFYNDQLIAALGIFVTWEGTKQASEAQLHLFWLPNKNQAIYYRSINRK
ncbi:tRNA(Ile)-lysidine synthase [Candidatus Moranella endobia PCVAL]|uniref:tRNA lysidine(34) synthetase TilS n=1 Tax=Candidatus Moranella endobia TaxID=1048758 RepID=UPI0002C6AF39|nr:tRNA lysidine(34) synthetase TilS [Candidatus Moranella endobia]AGJ61329.1 tRNA(Ile)-lysidine synthase [Candidatus Moranella endobia PCVAL]